MTRFLIVLMLILGSILANAVVNAGVEVFVPWLEIERQRSEDSTFDGLYFQFHGVKVDHKGSYRVFIETKDLRKAWKSKEPIQLQY